MLTTIPFSGFYYSLHDSAMDDALDMIFSDRETGCEINKELVWRASDLCHWGRVQNEYARDYAERLASLLTIPSLKFESLNSPREYNFTTDRIFCTISEDDVRRILSLVDSDALAALVRDTFTSRDGFISYYSPDVAEWGSVANWDHNQIGTLIQAYANQEHGGEFDSYAEYSLMEDCLCNGYLDSWIWEHTPGIDRLYKVHEYLQERQQRAAA